MRKTFSRYIAPVLAVVVFISVVAWFLVALDSAESVSQSEQFEAVVRSIEDDITLCYSIEGAYPASLEYLRDNYGLNYDSERYVVHYECFASNVRPVVTVVEKES